MRDVDLGAALEGDLVDRETLRRRAAVGSRAPAARSTSNWPDSASSSERARSSRSTVARNPIRPKLIANTGTPLPACLRSARRVAPSPPSTRHTSGVVAVVRRRTRASRPPRAPRPSAGASPPRSPSGRSWVKTSTVRIRGTVVPLIGAAGSSSASRAAVIRSSTPPRSASVHHMKLSRLPAGPGRPEEQYRWTLSPSATCRLSRGDQRLEPVLGLPHHAPLAHAPAPELELRLDESEHVEARGGAGDHRRQDLGQGDEGEVHHDQIRAGTAETRAAGCGRSTRSMTVTRGSSRRRQSSSP